MTLVGFRAQNHHQQVERRGALEKVDDRRTPPEIWEPLNEEFEFTLDAAASADNALCARYFSQEEDGLSQIWGRGERVWCNPPYSDCAAWVAKAWRACCDGAEVVVMLLPANRTEQRWWQESVEPFRDKQPRGKGATSLEVRFLPGRPRFGVPEGTYSDPRGNRPPFGVCLLIFRKGSQ